MNVLFLTSLNVSNVHYTLAKILKDEGLATSFLDTKETLFPRKRILIDDSRSWQIGTDSDCIDRQGDVEGKGVIQKVWSIWRLLLKHDLVFVSGWAGIFPLFFRKPYVYFAYGADLDQCTKYGTDIFSYLEYQSFPFSKKLRFCLLYRVARQIYRKVISGAAVVIIAPHQYSDMMRLTSEISLGFFPHPLQQEFFSVSLDDKERNKKLICNKLSCERFFFSSTRHVWSDNTRNEYDHKGNDILIKAFNKFISLNGDRDTVLVLVEKGQDVGLSKKLVTDLGIEKQVRWVSKVPRNELILYYSGADVCFDQFSVGCFTLCAVEAMACGTITISYIGDNRHNTPWYTTAPPVFNSKDNDEIALFLHSVMSDVMKKKEQEKASFYWVRENCTPTRIRQAFELLATKAAGGNGSLYRQG